MADCRYENCGRPVNSPHDDVYCLFHAPKEKKGISVEEFNRRLFEDLKARGNFQCAGFVFPGDIAFSVKDNPATLTNADFSHAQFHGRTDFSAAQFQGFADFSDAKFHGEARFIEVEFHGDVEFKKAQFLGHVRFDIAKFLGYAAFIETEFKGEAIFSEAQFKSPADFSRSQFNELAYFSTAQFQSDPDFSNAQFQGGAIFIEAQFQSDADFSSANFQGVAILSGARFQGNAEFPRAQFAVGEFRNCRFEKEAIFREARFQMDFDFREAQFQGKADFDAAQFQRGAIFGVAHFQCEAYFRKAQFQGGAGFSEAQFQDDANFHKAQFQGDAGFLFARFHMLANFQEAQFQDDADFSGTQFHEGEFWNCRFEKEAVFDQITCRGDSLDFSGVRLGPESVFSLRWPKAESNPPQQTEAESGRPPQTQAIPPKESLITFDRILFREYNAFFSGINAEPKDQPAGTTPMEQTQQNGVAEKSPNPILIFRHCRLNDVYISDCDLRFFSFYKSSFDLARFHSNSWGRTPEAKRKLLEEIWLERRENLATDEQKEEFNDKYYIKDLKDRREIATLYRRLKAAHDRTKDFAEAGHFYYQECEALRYYYRHEQKGALAKIRAALYYAYKLIAGYGEKPLRAFNWLVCSLSFFAVVNSSTGIYRLNGGTDPVLTRNLTDAIVFTCLRLIPINLFPFQQNLYQPHGFIGMMTALLNSLVPLVLVTFVLLGLKRRFRRY